ncbi:MAG: hypothetical protein HY321_19195 [Armatimonadetes bacterium]|nr:hypothetical protein [Armatimonadota bacterium]
MERWSDFDAGSVSADLERHFADPPDEFRPVPWLCYTGACTEAEVVDAIDQMHDQGIRSFFIFPIYGLEVPYLSEAWFDVVRKSVEHCARKGMTAWIYDDYNWPNGSCAGLLLAAHPEHNVWSLRPFWSAKPVAAGESAQLSFVGEVRRAFAMTEGGARQMVQVETEQTVDARGNPTTQVTWRNDGPASARLLVIASCPSLNRWVANKGCLWLKDSPATGYTDLLSREASDEFVRMTHEAYYEHLAPHFGKTVVGFFDDEPGIYGVSGNADLRQALRERHGRDLDDCLADLFLPGGEDRYRVRADYWRLAGELLGAHLKRIDDWCRDHQVDSTGHFLAEESPDSEVGSHGDSWLARREMSVPGLDLLGCQTNYEPPPGRGFVSRQRLHDSSGLVLTVKLAAAAARYRGVPRVMVEAYGVMPYWVAPVDLVNSTHWLSALGANLMNDNTLTLSFEGFRKRAQGGRHFTTPWWKFYRDFAEFAGRCSLMASVGAAPAPVGLLHPILTAQCLRTAAPLPERAEGSDDAALLAQSVQVCQQTAEALLRSHQDWEFVFEALIETGEVKQGKLVVPHAEFPALVVPAAHVLSEAVFARLEEFAASGGLLVFVGATPSISIEDGFNVRERVRALVALPNVHVVAAEPDITWQRLVPRLEAVLTPHAPPPVVLEGVGHEEIVTAHRVHDGRDLYQFANMSSRPLAARATVPGSGPLELWHPDDGKRYSIRTRENSAGRSFDVKLAPWEGYFVVSGSGETAALEPAPPRLFVAAPRRRPVSAEQAREAWDVYPFPGWQWDARRHAANVLPLQAWARLDPEDQGRKEEWYREAPAAPWILAVRDRLPAPLNPVECGVLWVKYTFNAGYVPMDLSVVVDSRAFSEGYLNGTPLANPVPCTLWDAANLRFRIGSLARSGENVLAFRTQVSEYYHPDVVLPHIFGPDILEPVALTGDFNSDTDDQGRALLARPRSRLRLGPWSAQGLSGYTGTITYSQSLTLDQPCAEAWLDLGEVHVAAEVSVNGVSAGRRCWPPYQFRVDPFLKEGENRFEIAVTNSLGSLLSSVGWDNYVGKVFAEAPSGWHGPARLWVRPGK